MRFGNLLIVRFSLFLTAGILTARFQDGLKPGILFFIILFFGLGISWYFSRRLIFQNIYFGIFTYSCFFAIGYFNFQLRLPANQPGHFSHQIENHSLLQLKIKDKLKPDRFNSKYLAEITAVNKNPSAGNVLVYITADSARSDFFHDMVLLVSANPEPLPASQNPHQFDYSEYLKTLGVYHQIRISGNEILQVSPGKKSLYGRAQRFREKIIEKLSRQDIAADERAVIQALVLGERKDLDQELYDAYAAAGVIHILAVSGLHVGILYLILNSILSLFYFQRRKKLIPFLIIVFILWAYAFLAGLSPSVTRAVMMFSLFAAATVFKRQTSSVNNLFLTLFLLLLINPNWLFQIGFQLSFLAVFFILWIQWDLYLFLKPRSFLVQKIWGLTSVTLCAQLGVLPLTLLYFNRFPALFLISNLAVVPFLSLLMFGGLLFSFLAFFDSLPVWLTTVYNFKILNLNRFVQWIAGQENFIITDIHFSVSKTIISYVLIFSGILCLKTFSLKRLQIFSVSLIVFFAVLIYEKKEQAVPHFIVFHKNKETLMGYKTAGHLLLFSGDTLSDPFKDFPVSRYRVGENINRLTLQTVPSYFRYRNQRILILDSAGLYVNHQDVDILILTNSPRVNLNRLLDSISPGLVLADGSNYASFVSKWEASCQSKKLPFQSTYKEGAFVLK